MKLIIDIPEEIYIEKKEDYIGDTLDRAIANGTPLKEELDKIKAKIESEYWDEFDGNTVIADNQIDRIFSKYIAELKGEE